MNAKQVKAAFADYAGGRLDEPARRAIERALEADPALRDYYRTMTALLERPGPDALPRLEPDPFLPTRVRQFERERRRPAAAPRWRWAASAALLSGALLAGVWLGRGLAVQATPDEDALMTAYYEAFAQSDADARYADWLDSGSEVAP